jgi:hypothetical protein
MTYIPHSSLVTILNLLDIFRFKLSAPSVSYYSHFTWPITVSNNRFVFRGTNFVDVMAPIFSREMLIEALPAFGENYSSWGHEHLWHKLLNERREFGVIIDSAPIANTRPAGQGTLPLYRPSDSDPREEVEAMFQKYNLDRTVKFRNLFGVTKYDGIVWGNTFTQFALSGYEEMSTLETDHLYRCVDFLSRGPRPIMSLQELRVMQGFARIEERYRIRPDLTLGSHGKSYPVSEVKADPLYAAEINSQRAEPEPPSIIEPI